MRGVCLTFCLAIYSGICRDLSSRIAFFTLTVVFSSFVFFKKVLRLQQVRTEKNLLSSFRRSSYLRFFWGVSPPPPLGGILGGLRLLIFFSYFSLFPVVFRQVFRRVMDLNVTNSPRCCDKFPVYDNIDDNIPTTTVTNSPSKNLRQCAAPCHNKAAFAPDNGDTD